MKEAVTTNTPCRLSNSERCGKVRMMSLALPHGQHQRLREREHSTAPVKPVRYSTTFRTLEKAKGN
jgi:hypothetical protein